MPDAFAPHLLAAFDRFGITDRTLRAGIAAVCFGESGFHPRTEQGYAHTSNDRIRKIFPSRFGPLTDATINDLKATDEKFFGFAYTNLLGNNQPGDGFRFRGRGINQLTGRSNYWSTGRRIGVDLIANPDAANDPETAALIAVDYMVQRGCEPSWTWEQVKRAVGNAVPGTEEAKDAAYERFLQSGEWGGS